MPQGELQTISVLSIYETDTFISANGEEIRQPNYRKLELQPYLEYGWREDVTLGGSVSIQQLNQGGSFNLENDNYVLSDPELFARTSLPGFSYQTMDWVNAAQLTVKLPSLIQHTDNAPQGGSDSSDVELRLFSGTNLRLPRLLKGNHFLELSAAYRHRLSNPGDQLRGDATLGLNLPRGYQLLGQMFGTYAIARPSDGGITNAANADFDLVKAQASLLIPFYQDTSLQLGLQRDLYARNTGKGGGALVGLWRRF